MNINVETYAPDYPPRPRVILDLDLEEFTALVILHGSYYNGAPGPDSVRSRISTGIDDVLTSLDSSWRAVVIGARNTEASTVEARVSLAFTGLQRGSF